ncbi:hypothetical protein CSUI_004119, partial [Cystoisospora suis]
MWLVDLAKILFLPSFSSSSPLAEDEDFFANYLSSLLTSVNEDTSKNNSLRLKNSSHLSWPSYLFSLKLLKELGDLLRKKKIQPNETSSGKIASHTKIPSEESHPLGSQAVCTPQKSPSGGRKNEKSLHSQISLNDDVSSLSSFLKAAFTFSSSCQSLFLLTELSFRDDALIRRGVRTPQNIQRGTKTGTVIDSSSSLARSGTVKRESLQSTSSSLLSEAFEKRRRRLRPRASASSGTCLVTSEEEEDEETPSRNGGRSPLNFSSSSSQGTKDVFSSSSSFSSSFTNLDFREIVLKGERKNYLGLELNLRHHLLLLILNTLRRYLPSLNKLASSSSSSPSSSVVDCVRDRESLSSFSSLQEERQSGDDGWSEKCDFEKCQKETRREREKKSCACTSLFLESKEDWVLFFKALVTFMEAVYVHLLNLRDELTLLPEGDPHQRGHAIQDSPHRSLRRENTFSSRFNEDKQNSVSCRGSFSAIQNTREVLKEETGKDFSSCVFTRRRLESSFTSPSSAAEILRCIDTLASLEGEKKSEKNFSNLLHFLRSLQDLLHEAHRYLSSPHSSLETSLIENAALAEENRLLTFIQLLQPLTIAGAVYIHLPPSPRADELLPPTSISPLSDSSSKRRNPTRASSLSFLSSHSSTTTTSPSSSSSSFHETSTDADFGEDHAFFFPSERHRRRGVHHPSQSESERSSHSSSPTWKSRFSERREDEDFKKVSTSWRSSGVSCSSSSSSCHLSSHAKRGEERTSSSSSPSLRKTAWRPRPRVEPERKSDHGEREEDGEEQQEKSRRRRADSKNVRSTGRREGRGRVLESHRNRLRCISLQCMQLAIRLSPKSLFRSWPLILSPPQGFKINFSFFSSSSSSSRSPSSPPHTSGLYLGSSVLQRDGIESERFHERKEVTTLARSNHTYLSPLSSGKWCMHTSKPTPLASASSPTSSLSLSPSSPSRQLDKSRSSSPSSSFLSSSSSPPSLSSGQWAASYLLVDTRLSRLSLHQQLWMSIVRLDADFKVRRSAIDCLVTLLETSPLSRWPATALEPCLTSSFSSSLLRPFQEGRSSSVLSLHSFFSQATSDISFSSSPGRESLHKKQIDSFSSSFDTGDLPFLHSRTPCSLLTERKEVSMYLLWLWRRKTDEKQNSHSFPPSTTTTSSSSSLLPSPSSSSSSSSYPYLLRKGGLASSFNSLSGNLFSSTRLIIFHLFAFTEDLCHSIHLLLLLLTLPSSSFSSSPYVSANSSPSMQSLCLSSVSVKDMIRSRPCQIVELHYQQSLMSLEIPLRALTRLVRTLPLTAFRPGVLLACLRLVYPFFLGFLKYLLSQSLLVACSSSSSSLQSLKRLIECFLPVRNGRLLPPSENLYVKYAEKAIDVFSLFPRDLRTSSSSSPCSHLRERRDEDDRLILETPQRQREEKEQQRQNEKEEKEKEEEYKKTCQQKTDEDRRREVPTEDITSSIVFTSFHVSILSAATALIASIVSIKPFRFEVLEGLLLNLSVEEGKSLRVKRKTALMLHSRDTSNSSSSSLLHPDTGVYIQPERKDESEADKTNAFIQRREGKQEGSMGFSEKKERGMHDKGVTDDDREMPHSQRTSFLHVEDLNLLDALLLISCILVSTIGNSPSSSSSFSSSSLSSPGVRRKEGYACFSSGEKEGEQEERFEDTSREMSVKRKKKKEEGKEDTEDEEEGRERLERREHDLGVWRDTLRDMFLNLLSRKISKTYAEVFLLSFLLQTSSCHPQKNERNSFSSSLVLLLLELLLSSPCSLSPQGKTPPWPHKLQGLSLAMDLLSVFHVDDDGSSHARTHQNNPEEEVDEEERDKKEEEENEEREEDKFPEDRRSERMKSHEEKETGRDSSTHAALQEKEKKSEREKKKSKSEKTEHMTICCLSSSSCCCCSSLTEKEREEEEELSEEEDQRRDRGKMRRTSRRRRPRCMRREILDLVWQHVWHPLFFVGGLTEENDEEEKEEGKKKEEKNEEKYENENTPLTENLTPQNSRQSCLGIGLSSTSFSVFASSPRQVSDCFEGNENRDKTNEVQEKKEEDRIEANETRERELRKESERQKKEEKEEEEEYSTYVVTACEVLRLLRYEDWAVSYPSFLHPTFGYELASVIHPSKPPVSIMTPPLYLSFMAPKEGEEEEQRCKKSIFMRKKQKEKVEKNTSMQTNSIDRRAFIEPSSLTFSSSSSGQDLEEKKKGTSSSSSSFSSSSSSPDSGACVVTSLCSYDDSYHVGEDENEEEREEERKKSLASSVSSSGRDAGQEQETRRREEEKEEGNEEENRPEKDDEDGDRKKKKKGSVTFLKQHEERSDRCLYTSKLSESMELALIEIEGLYIRYSNIYRRGSYGSSPSCLDTIRKRNKTCLFHQVETGERTPHVHDTKEAEEEKEEEDEEKDAKAERQKEEKFIPGEHMNEEKKRQERVRKEQGEVELQLTLSRLAGLCSLITLFDRCLLFGDFGHSSVRVFSSCERKVCLLLKIFSDIYSPSPSSSSFSSSLSSFHTKSIIQHKKTFLSGSSPFHEEIFSSSSSLSSSCLSYLECEELSYMQGLLQALPRLHLFFLFFSRDEAGRGGEEEIFMKTTTTTGELVRWLPPSSIKSPSALLRINSIRALGSVCGMYDWMKGISSSSSFSTPFQRKDSVWMVGERDILESDLGCMKESKDCSIQSLYTCVQRIHQFFLLFLNVPVKRRRRKLLSHEARQNEDSPKVEGGGGRREGGEEKRTEKKTAAIRTTSMNSNGVAIDAACGQKEEERIESKGGGGGGGEQGGEEENNSRGKNKEEEEKDKKKNEGDTTGGDLSSSAFQDQERRTRSDGKREVEMDRKEKDKGQEKKTSVEDLKEDQHDRDHRHNEQKKKKIDEDLSKNTGKIKMQWNACYAIRLLYSNPTFIRAFTAQLPCKISSSSSSPPPTPLSPSSSCVFSQLSELLSQK